MLSHNGRRVEAGIGFFADTDSGLYFVYVDDNGEIDGVVPDTAMPGLQALINRDGDPEGWEWAPE